MDHQQGPPDSELVFEPLKLPLHSSQPSAHRPTFALPPGAQTSGPAPLAGPVAKPVPGSGSTPNKTDNLLLRVNQLITAHNQNLVKEMQQYHREELLRQHKVIQHFIYLCLQCVEKVIQSLASAPSQHQLFAPGTDSQEKIQSLLKEATGPQFQQGMKNALENQSGETDKALLDLFKQTFGDILAPKISAMCFAIAEQIETNFDDGLRSTLQKLTSNLQKEAQNQHAQAQQPSPTDQRNIASLNDSLQNLSAVALKMTENIVQNQATFTASLGGAKPAVWQ